MARFIQDSDSHGSLKDIQIVVNTKPELFDSLLTKEIGSPVHITWKSPVKDHQYAEYRDNSFLEVLGVKDTITVPLSQFWPQNGPQWDALGIDKETVFIVEAKANIPEIVTPATGASPISKDEILEAFNATKEYLGVSNPVDWSGTFYQYANRIAHLYYLRVLNNIDTHLVFVYFLNDTTVEGPKSIDEWSGAIQVVEKYLGIPKNHKLKKYIHKLFIDVKELGV